MANVTDGWSTFSGGDKSWEDWAMGMLRPILALTVVAVALIISFIQGLGLESEMMYAIGRAFIQLTFIGFVLEFIFRQDNVIWIFVAYVFMVIVAGYTAGTRAKNVPNAKYLSGVSIFIGTFTTMVLLVLLRVFPFTPRYFIPVAGMIIGYSMSVTGVTLKRFREDLRQSQGSIETALALGATPRQATAVHVRRALIIGLSPKLDNAKVTGLITLPGAMSGLIMGGAAPIEAVQLQIVVLNIMLGSAILTAVLATNLAWQSFFTKTYQLKTRELAAE